MIKIRTFIRKIEKEMEERLHIHCPKCSNQRLLDLCGKGIIKIKCPICRQEVILHLEECDKEREKRLYVDYRKKKLGTRMQRI